MCGINGYLGFTNREQALAQVAHMNATLQHRGPDNLDSWADNTAALGHARLSIIDLSAGANQPFVSACGNYIIVFNGEIYNYKQVLQKLEAQTGPVNLRTQSDTEVLLQAYIAVGEICLQWLNGMFAFAIWNKKDQSLFMARDRAGEKPLYYTQQNGAFLFSSEIRALMAGGLVPKKLNRAALPGYVQYQTVHAPDTLIENVYMLMPGHSMVWQNNRLDAKCYWKPVIYETDPATNPVKRVKELFEESIRLRMVADVEVGAFLSGGIDSSAVVAQMSRLSAKPISTFSVIFGEKDFSEEEFSNQISRQYNTNHHPLRIHAADFLHDIPAILRAVDFPGGDGPNTYVVAQATRKTGIKVALTGLGGDELFAGYPIFTQLYSFNKKRWLQKTPRPLRQAAGTLAQALKKGVTGQKLKRIMAAPELNNAVFYSLSRQLFDRRFVNELLNTQHTGKYPVQQIAESIFTGAHSHHVLSQVSIAEISTYMQNVLLRDSDQMTMAHALEVRAPFLDHHLMEYALSVNDVVKFPHTPKQLFVHAMGDLLPPEVVNRKKMGFTFPWAYWMRHELQSYCAQRIQQLGQRPYFDVAQLNLLWQKFLANDKTVTWSRVWHLVTLEEWLTTNGID